MNNDSVNCRLYIYGTFYNAFKKTIFYLKFRLSHLSCQNYVVEKKKTVIMIILSVYIYIYQGVGQMRSQINTSRFEMTCSLISFENSIQFLPYTQDRFKAKIKKRFDLSALVALRVCCSWSTYTTDKSRIEKKTKKQNFK